MENNRTPRPYSVGQKPHFSGGSRPPFGTRRPPVHSNDSGYKINREIRAAEVRLVGDNIDNAGEVYNIQDALRIAETQGLDLVEISPTAEPPVCKVMDLQKFLYQQRRKQKELKANQAKVDVKEIRFGYATGEHDYQFKLKHAENFLSEGNKVRAYVFFRGREISFAEQGQALLARFANDLGEIAKVEALPKLEGKRMNLMLVPKSKKG
ncbi:translation initiation factor IF-3 [Bacteroidia bacterium]|nr:translation initiation factor IF-3 [Bacteroidia bacterium]